MMYVESAVAAVSWMPSLGGGVTSPSPPPNLPKALISVDAKVTNPSSFELHDLDVFSIDIYTDDSWPKTVSCYSHSLAFTDIR